MAKKLSEPPHLPAVHECYLLEDLVRTLPDAFAELKEAVANASRELGAREGAAGSSTGGNLAEPPLDNHVEEPCEAEHRERPGE